MSYWCLKWFKTVMCMAKFAMMVIMKGTNDNKCTENKVKWKGYSIDRYWYIFTFQYRMILAFQYLGPKVHFFHLKFQKNLLRFKKKSKNVTKHFMSLAKPIVNFRKHPNSGKASYVTVYNNIWHRHYENLNQMKFQILCAMHCGIAYHLIRWSPD